MDNEIIPKKKKNLKKKKKELEYYFIPWVIPFGKIKLIEPNSSTTPPVTSELDCNSTITNSTTSLPIQPIISLESSPSNNSVLPSNLEIMDQDNQEIDKRCLICLEDNPEQFSRHCPNCNKKFHLECANAWRHHNKSYQCIHCKQHDVYMEEYWKTNKKQRNRKDKSQQSGTKINYIRVERNVNNGANYSFRKTLNQRYDNLNDDNINAL